MLLQVLGTAAGGGLPQWNTLGIARLREARDGVVVVETSPVLDAVRERLGLDAISLTVAPDGTVLPCPAAGELLGPDAPNVRNH
ncbi:hypothetical protein ACWGH2_03310 [Streptomyces sp. NPDC054871]